MAEYIDRGIAIAKLTALEVTDRNAMMTSAKRLLAYMPAADVATVVRCKDCKHYEIHKPKVLENCERNGYIIPMKPDDFCSHGERKDGNNDT